MQRDIKIGLSVICVLLLALGGATYWRVFHAHLPAAGADAPRESSDEIAADETAPAVMPVHAPIALEPSRRYDEQRVADRSAARERPDGSADRPPSSFLPAAEEPRANERYGRGVGSADRGYDQRAADEQDTNAAHGRRADDPSAESRTANPFHRTSAEVAADEPNRTTPALFSPDAPPTTAEEPPAESSATILPSKPLRSETGAAWTDSRAAGAGGAWSQPNRPATREPSESADTRSQSPTSDGKYTVQPNDNFWLVSEKVYGTGAYFKAVHEHNRANYPRAAKLEVGDVLEVPPVATLEQNYPDLCPKPRHRSAPQARTMAASSRQGLTGKQYKVEEGDTLFDIARYELGKASRWAEIYELNRDSIGQDFDYLQPGTQLVLPAGDQDTDSLTRQGQPTYQR